VDDKAFQSKYLSVARLLWEAAEGCADRIPIQYAEHLSHTYVNGDISLGSLLPRVEDYSELDGVDIEEAIEMLGRVNPGDWPDVEEISGISLEELLRVYDESATGFDFVEDNLGTAEKVEEALMEVISSVFGDQVSNIRSEKGFFPNQKNNFLQEEDGTFAGMFSYEGNKFMFEIAPSEDGWLCTYRMHADSLDKLPPIPSEDDDSKSDYTRRLRHRGWK